MKEVALHTTRDNCRKEIERELKSYFEDKKRDALDHEFISQVYERLEEYVLREGARVASCSTLLVYKGYEKSVHSEIVRVCAGLELYRHAILVHDDLVDMDEVRRGGTAFHKLFEALSRRFGESAGIFAGNLLYSLALDCILTSQVERNKLFESLRVLNRAYTQVNESQILDVLFEYKEPDEGEWYQMASKRAASLFRATMLIGAILANAPERDKTILSNAAEHMGYAFDIRDDIMGTFGTEEEYGREPKGDLALFKKPLHLIYTLANARAGSAFDLRALLERNDMNGARELIRAYGLEPAKDKSRAHARTALTLIEQTHMNGDIKQFFRDFIGYISGSLDRY